MNSLTIREWKNSLKNNGFAILPLVDKKPILIAKTITSELEKKIVRVGSNLQRSEFHFLVEESQKKLNASGVLQEWVLRHESSITRILDGEELFWVSVMKLRAVRPKSLLGNSGHDHVPMHRESLYALTDQVKFQYNCWVPLSDAATVSGMRYLPGSHNIPDSELSIDIDETHPVKVERYSSGHRIGLPYQPKLIRHPSLIEEKNLKRFSVSTDCFLLFSAMLIHGGGENQSEMTRFSMDTGCLPMSRLVENSPLFAAGGKKHYLPSTEL
jgi:hypothetical protein